MASEARRVAVLDAVEGQPGAVALLRRALESERVAQAYAFVGPAGSGRMTTAIALETSKGDLALALGLGVILITLSLIINGAAFVVRDAARREA